MMDDKEDAMERDPRAVRLAAQEFGVTEDVILSRSATGLEARAQLAFALEDFWAEVKKSFPGRILVKLVREPKP